ncbi:hypothetical protein DL991_10540 [Amycolatopsis sp. WAC 01375]|uniref:hypothetical protein n=1 Tax=Amycolatopsis sp. WAC 01375 TaxID=2203194 RepID=UPI000F77077C|nr:hypothetical protein [Amycolatopsis sp. WAC 01375]RSM80545.1 hypothetical protein DL991_10540 [Amycolatopsis sp. WAC 01375]
MQKWYTRSKRNRGAAASPQPGQRKRGLQGKPTPAPATRPTWGQQALLTGLQRDYTRFNEATDVDLSNPWLRWARHLTYQIAERRGWSQRVRHEVDRSLAILLSTHVDGDKIAYTAMSSALQPLRLSCDRATDVLNEMGILDDDRRPAFEDWLRWKLEDIAPGIACGTERWLRTLHDGGPRSRPRGIYTVWQYGRLARPILLAWSAGYGHLREVTRQDVLEVLEPLHGSDRDLTLVALRSLFQFCKNNGIVFRNPTARIRGSNQQAKVIQPLRDDQVQRSVAGAGRPADRLLVALAAIHAARSSAIRALQLEDIDLGDRRLVIAGRSRPLDELTHRLLVEWLDYRRTRWPNTANPHVLINQRTAFTLGQVSRFWLIAGFRGQEVTLDRLRVDRQLEEAIVHGADPLHLAVVFDLAEQTAIHYANSARQLLEAEIERGGPG